MLVSKALRPACRIALTPERDPIALSSSDDRSHWKGPKMTAQERELQSRSLRREVNERIAELIEAFHSETEVPVMTVFCECGSEGCMAPIEMTLTEYQAVRAAPTRWVISSSHIDTSAVSIVARRNGYALIDRRSERLSREAPSPRKEPTSPLTTNSSER
jgi:hypothetical protein